MDLRNNLFGRGPRGGAPPRPAQGAGAGGQGSYSQVPQRSFEDRRPPPPQHPGAGGSYGGSQPIYAEKPMPPPQQPRRGAAVRLQMEKLNEFIPDQQQRDPLVFRNLCVVSTQDFPEAGKNLYLLLRNIRGREFVVTACKDDRIPGGRITLTDPQRKWTDITLRDSIEAEVYNPTSELIQIEIFVTYARKPASPKDTPYTQAELKGLLQNLMPQQVLSPEQQFVTKLDNVFLHFKVQKVACRDAGNRLTELTGNKDVRGVFNPQLTEVSFTTGPDLPIPLQGSTSAPRALLRPNFNFASLGIGGLDDEFSTIFRRAFASRVFPPGVVEQMGISHVKGVLLYGPPGTGKTLIARQIGQMLNARPPKIINGPEILNKYVGQSEENVRKMFADAEKEYKDKGDASELHIIIFDELDAVCKQRGSGGGGTGVGDSVVNQLLSKLDGVDQLNNILLIGMTNRKDMIDDALLRPGRLEVHVEISLPDEKGRLQILNIHTSKIRNMNKLADDVDLNELARLTKNYSGAEMAGLVKAALSYAFTRHTQIGEEAGIKGKDDAGVKGDPQSVMLTWNDLMRALEDVKPAFGISEDELNSASPYGIIHFSPHIKSILSTGLSFAKAVRSSEKLQLFSFLVHGPQGAGKTALAAEIGLQSEFPFVKIIKPVDVGTNEAAKLEYLRRAFSDAYKSTYSIVILDGIENIIDWNPIGMRFSNAVVQYLGALLDTRPPKGRKLLVIATTSQRSMLNQHGVFKFDREIAVPAVHDRNELRRVLEDSGRFDDDPATIEETLNELQSITGTQSVGIGIKAVFTALETALEREPVAVSLAEDISAIMAARNPSDI
ncbi:P-loop containing nucleoside triphosphate hydrolase protein [Xylariomycetidae sp. FL0641]|nr:P-loop containing nucleoside triphosphate hydrolase protein [Xylariomycetidae sp. FL0641]